MLAACGLMPRTVNAASRFEKQDFRASVPRFAPDALPANMALADLVKTWAARKNVTPAQLSLAWLSAHKPWIVPIPGTTNVAHLKENIATASVRFGSAELKELNAAVAAIPIRGERLWPCCRRPASRHRRSGERHYQTFTCHLVCLRAGSVACHARSSWCPRRPSPLLRSQSSERA